MDSYRFVPTLTQGKSIMLMYILVAVLIAMMGFALARHWKVRNDKTTIASPHRPHRVARRRS